MHARRYNSCGSVPVRWLAGVTLLAALVVLPYPAPAQTVGGEVDRVVAVVNNTTILASDLDLEMRLFDLLPARERGGEAPAQALERLTTRALIEQQILREDPHGMEIAAAALEASLNELRQNLPACKQRDCGTGTGWARYLATLQLTPDEVQTYWENRLAVLRFIELRFRSGIRIAPEEIAKYYHETLLPQYARAEDAPTLDKVSARIEEILLQQQVNGLLNDWLKTLQDEGQVEVLDPGSVPPPAPAGGGAGAGGGR
jgi:hypothetical protein